MRYKELIKEGDERIFPIQALKNLIDHPNTPQHERENAISILNRIFKELPNIQNYKNYKRNKSQSGKVVDLKV